MTGQVGREAECQAGTTAPRDASSNTHNGGKLRGGGAGGREGSREETDFAVGERVRSLQRDGDCIQDYMVMIRFRVDDKMADPFANWVPW